MKYKVTTADVDGSGTRYFKSLAGAVKRFEEMLGYSVKGAIDEMYFKRAEAGKPMPTIECLRRLAGYSHFGTRVCFEVADDEAHDLAIDNWAKLDSKEAA